MPAISLHIPHSEIKRLEDTIAVYSAALQKDMTVELLRQGQLLVKSLIKTTPPKKISSGKRRITKDINKSIEVINPDKTTNKELKNRLKEIKRQKDYTAANQIFGGKTKLKKLTFIDFTSDIHKKERLNGKDSLEVPKKTGFATFDKTEQTAYTRKVKNRAGKLKSSWYPAANKLMVSVPGYVSKHAAYGYSVGSCQIRLNGDEPTIYIRNRSTGQALLRRVLESSLRHRQQAMIKEMENTLKRFVESQSRKGIVWRR